MKRGFTLIELLVVIAIIAILAAILFPVFARARAKATQTSCLNNLKELTLGMLMYAQDYDEIFPGMSLGPAQPNPVVPGNTTFNYHPDYGYFNCWSNGIYPYVKNVQIYLCPSSLYECYEVAYGVPANGGNAAGDGRVTLFGSGSSAPKMARIKRPAEILIMTEKGAGGGCQYLLSAQYYACRDSHSEGGNLGFFDGHAKWLKFEHGPIGHGWPPPHNASYEIHPPYHTFANPFG